MATGTQRPRSMTLPATARELSLPGGAVPWLDGLRRDALERAQASGLPTMRVEAWKYTNLARLAKLDFAAAPDAGADAGALAMGHASCHRLIFVNGRALPAPDLPAPDLPAGVRLDGLAALLDAEPDLVEPHLGQVVPPDGHALANLNLAFLGDGCLLHVARDCVVEAPIHLAFVTHPGAAPFQHHPRLLVVAEAGSRVTILESHEARGAGTYWANPVTEVRVGDGARVRHYKLQDEAHEAYHTALTKVHVGRGGRYDSFVLSVGGALSRNEIHVALAGEGATCRLDGGYLMRGRQHADTTTRIDHMVAGCTSRETYKGVLDDRSRGVFQGKIVVREGAQKSDGHQLSRTLLLSPRAEIDTKPELEIYADDVKCGHGATVGELDADQLFYLRARGIDEAAARNLLIVGFLGELVAEIACTGARRDMGRALDAWLAGRGALRS